MQYVKKTIHISDPLGFRESRKTKVHPQNEDNLSTHRLHMGLGAIVAVRRLLIGSNPSSRKQIILCEIRKAAGARHYQVSLKSRKIFNLLVSAVISRNRDSKLASGIILPGVRLSGVETITRPSRWAVYLARLAITPSRLFAPIFSVLPHRSLAKENFFPALIRSHSINFRDFNARISKYILKAQAF